jgi:hypothetical protein
LAINIQILDYSNAETPKQGRKCLFITVADVAIFYSMGEVKVIPW